MKTVPILFFLAACLGSSTAAWAQGATVTSVLTSRHVKPAPAAASSHPEALDDVIEYCATYFNAGDSDSEAVMAVVPVPAGSTLVAGSARPARQAQVSTDAVSFSPLPPARAAEPAGEGGAATDAYRAVRWDLGVLPGGASAVVRLRVRTAAPTAQPGIQP